MKETQINGKLVGERRCGLKQPCELWIPLTVRWEKQSLLPAALVTLVNGYSVGFLKLYLFCLPVNLEAWG